MALDWKDLVVAVAAEMTAIGWVRFIREYRRRGSLGSFVLTVAIIMG